MMWQYAIATKAVKDVKELRNKINKIDSTFIENACDVFINEMFGV